MRGPRYFLVRCSILLLILVAGLEARTVRVASFNLEYGPGAPGTSDYEATKAVLARINADIVAFQEIYNDGQDNRVPYWRQMAAELGYTYNVVAEVNGGRAGWIYLGYYSRYPLQTYNVNSPAPASEMTRLPMRAVVQVPGAAKPLVLWNMHHKASGGPSNHFRRAVEAYRIVQDINAYTTANPGHDEFLLLGDLNDDIDEAANQTASFVYADFQTFSSAAGWPSGYVLGSDIEEVLRQSSLPYRAFPDGRYGSAGGGLHRLDLRQQNGTSRATIGTRMLDYIFVSTALRDSPLAAPRGEIYNSALEAIHPGLPKSGSPLASGTSRAASDHLAVFADIEMADAEPAPFITSFAPAAAAPGATVTITGFLLGGVESVLFGGVEASFLSVSDTQITATVPAGAVTGPITVSGPDGGADSFESFLVASMATAEFAVPTPSSLEGFTTMSGAPSAARSLTISAAGLRGPLQVTAPAGFEVSRDGVNFGPSVEIAAPPRQDSAANYGVWADGSNGGSGFSPWEIYANDGSGQAGAYLANPAASGVFGMSTQTFALNAAPLNSDASVWVWRGLQRPLAVGETFSFDWGVNWDSDGGSKGFAIASGSVAMLYVIQYGFPGPIYLLHDGGSPDTGLAFGQQPMRWSFRQVDATTLNVTATPRTGGTNVAYSTNITVPGAVNSFWWFADQMQPDERRISYYDNLSIAPSGTGGGALEAVTVQVRLAADAGVGAIDGQMQLTSGGDVLASVSLSGSVTGAGDDYVNWAAFYGLDPQGDGAPGADRDGDGHSNWLEFAFGTSPVASDGALIETRTSGAGVTFEFLRRQTGVIYNILHTANLATVFSAASGIDLSVSSDQAGVPEGWEKVSFTVPASGAGFYRIGASPN
jgi:endonuclease/exonuclease/phosphatase family metal-dependent hydrolase